MIQALDLDEVNILGHSMGSSVIWSYYDLFGPERLSKLLLIDQMPMITSNPAWSEEERIASGAIFTPQIALRDDQRAGRPRRRRDHPRLHRQHGHQGDPGGGQGLDHRAQPDHAARARRDPALQPQHPGLARPDPAHRRCRRWWSAAGSASCPGSRRPGSPSRSRARASRSSRRRTAATTSCSSRATRSSTRSSPTSSADPAGRPTGQRASPAPLRRAASVSERLCRGRAQSSSSTTPCRLAGYHSGRQMSSRA